MKNCLLLFIGLFISINLFSQTKVWDRTFGASNDDVSIFNFIDSAGNIYVFGTINNSTLFYDITTQYGLKDYTLIKYDKNGNKIFDKCYGGNGDDELKKVIVDGNNFYLIGISNSPISGVKTDPVSCAPYTNEIYYFSIDRNGTILSQDNVCLPSVVSMNNTGNNPIEIKDIYDFKLLSNGQFVALILANNYSLGSTNETIVVAINYSATFSPNASGVLFSYYTSSYNNPNFEKFYGGKIIQIPSGDYIIGLTMTIENWSSGTYPSFFFDRNYISTVFSIDASMNTLNSLKYFFNNYRESFFHDVIYFNNKIYVISSMFPYNNTTYDIGLNITSTYYSQGSQIIRQSPTRCNVGQKDLVIHKLNTNLSYDSDFSFGVNGTINYSSFTIDTASQILNLFTSTDANNSFDKSSNSKGGFDYWQLNLKLGSAITKVDDKNYGGTSDDFCSYASSNKNGTFITGSSISGVGGDKTQSQRGLKDIWNVTLCKPPRYPVIYNAGQIFNVWSTFGCTGKSKTLQVDSINPAYSYYWYNQAIGGNFIDTGIFYTTPIISQTNAPIYLESNNGLCASQRLQVFVTPIKTPQKPSIVTPSVICKRDTLTIKAFRDTATGTYPVCFSVWYDSLKTIFNYGLDSFHISGIHGPVKYFLTTKDSFPGGTSQGYSYLPTVCESRMDSIVITPDSVITPIISSPNPTCFGTTITLSVSNNSNYTVNWSDQTNNQLVYAGNPFIISNMTGNDSFLVQFVKANGCKSLQSNQTIILEKPIASFSCSITNLNAGNAIQLANSSLGASSYYWNFGDGDISYAQNPWHYFNIPGTFSIKLVVTSSTGCMDSITRLNYIFVNPYVGMGELEMQIITYPNPATGDLFIFSEGYEIQLNLINSIGQPVWSNNEWGNHFIISTHEFPKGIYHLEIIGRDFSSIKKVILE